eukprot:EG_transcript_4513
MHSPLKPAAQAPLLPVTPPRNTTTYTNNPYSFENFTPPPLEIGRIRFGQEEVPLEEIETDQHKIQQRQKQIGFGKSTKGYETYARLVVKHLREIDNDYHPVTPRADQKCSKRSWDGQLKRWRRLLHRWDDVPQPEDVNSPLSSDADGQLEDEVRERTFVDMERCSVSLMDLFPDEPSNHSWASECSEAPELDDLSDLSDSLDGSEAAGGLRAMRRSL